MAIAKTYPLSEEQCAEIGGHCFVESNAVMASFPPTYSRTCKHCGLTQWGSAQPSIAWKDRD